MPLSDLELCATALLKIGARPIASLGEPGPEGECARRLYPVVKNALLVAHPWTFTLATASIAADEGADSGAFARAFPLPSDTLRVISAGAGSRGRGLTFALAGRYIQADADTIVLSYQRETPESDFPAHFVAPLITKLAAEFCVPLTEGSARAKELFVLAEAELRSARLIDSQQATPRRIEDFSLIDARR